MNKQTRIVTGICVVACMYMNQAYADNECSTQTCGCEIHSCAPTHAGSYCTTNGTNCDLHGNHDYSCNQWCTTYSNTCAPASGQLGASECGTI